ncbi:MULTISPECIES: cyclic nucleotide-binding and patatin-like phospholipase domain-containing protein [unclassified Bradyrhizobium]|uniref:cyclic nucleotide-binding and patatin-like phospholipase domain-containing protein n=1 Tax=unclassified Bradyrhizobium TaxID=2631580 RepID=UPI001BAB662D|nr:MULTISPECIES: cyclic nucleotide-binding and patatin-like phospholipase domain-containing protein [unclassified Bradyrhizobium]MBR1225502.1 patatin-like phospholipase family protein [Bradyrhizobium sp. AUGA SZCCT0176]MBR1298013.1 patatin-like phospholipase family protein [Bradyrhizobium sp. AUGA SZCCT0042]
MVDGATASEPPFVPDAPLLADAATPPEAFVPSDVSIFRMLTAEQRQEIRGFMRELVILRGEELVAEGDASDAFFEVVRGAFTVQRAGDEGPIAELGPGDLIGEIGFFGKIRRTATVTAIRDSCVLSLSRAAYNKIATEAPSIVGFLLEAMALRVAETTSRVVPNRQLARTRTIVVLEGGREPVPPQFYALLTQALGNAVVEIVTSQRINQMFPGRDPDDEEITGWLHRLEQASDLVAYFGDRELTRWTQKCIRQSDQVLFVCRGRAPDDSLTEVEAAASTYHRTNERRLVLVHDERSGEVRGTGAWLRRMPVFMHHHISLQDDIDVRSLARFLLGRAIGFVAAGGGGLGPAHLGIYKAFRERGVDFDIFVGTSVGAAMVAGFAKNLEAEDLDRGTDDIFVKSRSFKRPTWPRYSLLDHKALDRALAEALGADCNIEDCWKPFAAVATNLSTQAGEVIRTGSLWQAVRASASIPGILPPFYTKDGSMLVDGCLIDNIPLAPMHNLKRGPNLVVHFGKQEIERFEVDYDALPGRLKLISSLLLPFGKKRLPRAPSAVSVLWRSLLVHQRVDSIPVGPADFVMRPPTIPGAKVMEFDNHKRVFEASYLWAKSTLESAEGDQHAALLAILSKGSPLRAAAGRTFAELAAS